MRAGLCAKISARSRYWLDLLELNSAERSVIFGIPRCASGQSGSLDRSWPISGATEDGRLEIESPSRARAAKVDTF